ncbi:MAG: RNA polymerase sigma-70 factor [Cyclobacteriaceae bacterium]|nr:RNA polymerase sigma-70 factor [Cyclobacteriaceae bacterium]
MCRLSTKYIYDFDASKDIVHEVFIAFWQKIDGLPDDTNYKSYLYTAVRNKSFNFLRDTKKHLNIVDAHEEEAPANGDSIEARELSREIEFALNLLPNRCKEVFELSRFDDLKYSQIAEKLNISIKTVEGQMSKALRLLREHLKEFMILIIYLALK